METIKLATNGLQYSSRTMQLAVIITSWSTHARILRYHSTPPPPRSQYLTTFQILHDVVAMYSAAPMTTSIKTIFSNRHM